MAVAQCYGLTLPATSQVSPETRLAPQVIEPLASKTQPPKVQRGQKKSADASRVTKTKQTSLEGTSWLLAQDPRFFTLQLVAAQDKQAVLDYICTHNLHDKVAYFQHLRDGRRWFSVVHGVFATRSHAKKAIVRLPRAVQKTRPWIRQFDAIHRSIRETR